MKYLIAIFLSLSVSVMGIEDLPTAKLNTGSYAEVNAKALKAIVDSGVPVVIIDTRPTVSKGDKQIPKSIHLRSDASDREILATLTSRNALIVIYCQDLKCNEDADLAAHLLSMGYRNVIEFTPGLNEWLSSDYPVQIVK